MSAMSDEGHEDSGLFGKLPSSRPGVRSPRRASSKGAAEPRSQPPRPTPPRPKPTGARSEPAARPRAGSDPSRRPRSEAAASSESDPSSEGEGAGLEELA